MVKKKNKRTLKNLIFLTIGQVITVLIGLFLPRIFMVNFGSAVNGLMSSVNQYLVYLTLFEAGIGTAVLQKMYKPVVNDDKEDLNSILVATSKYYKKTAFWYLLALLTLSFVYPLLVQNEVEYWLAAGAIFFTGASKVVLFYYFGKYKILLQAEGKQYIISNITTTITVLVSIGKILAVYIFGHPIAVFIVAFLINSSQAIIYFFLIKTKYKWINLKVKPKEISVKQRTSNLIHRICTMIFANTDLIILTIFCDLKIVSVYTVYKLVCTHLESLINIVNDSYRHSLGQTFNVDIDVFKTKFDKFQKLYNILIYSIFAVCIVLYIPFVQIYTKSITDTNYVDLLLPILFTLSGVLDLARNPCLTVIHFASHFKETLWRTITGTVINIVLSLILVNFIGIYGVLIGTIVALFYKTVDNMVYANKTILKRGWFNTVFILFVNIFTIFIFYITTKNIIPDSMGLFDFFKYGCVLLLNSIAIFFIINHFLTFQKNRVEEKGERKI